MTGMIFDIKKFAINDGPGIRTAVFLKGCPLKCWWCHNPESQEKSPELSFSPDKCIGCGFCRSVCPNGLNRENCIHCGECTAQCYAGARELIGKEISVDEVITEVLKDRPFYKNSGGGMTISGGEPLYQPEFTAGLLAAAKKENLHTCLDTSGFASWSTVEKVLPLVDLFLYDLKETDAEKHLLYTGVPLDIILENLQKIDAAGGKTILRCPLIPSLNDRKEHAAEIARIASGLKNLQEINLMPYHPLGESKLARLGKDSRYSGDFAKQKDLEELRLLIEERVSVPVSFS